MRRDQVAFGVAATSSSHASSYQSPASLVPITAPTAALAEQRAVALLDAEAGVDADASMFSAVAARPIRSNIVVPSSTRNSSLASTSRIPKLSVSGRMEAVHSQVELNVNGVRMRPGEVIFGDVNGVVVIPFELVGTIADAADANGRAEADCRRRSPVTLQLKAAIHSA